MSEDILPIKKYDLSHPRLILIPDIAQVKSIVNSLDNEGRWLIKHGMTSHPYSGNGVRNDDTKEFGNTFVGDETDTSPFRDRTDQLYISTGEFIRNMRLLINFVESVKFGLTEEQMKSRQL